jgi:hypothetical protein
VSVTFWVDSLATLAEAPASTTQKRIPALPPPSWWVMSVNSTFTGPTLNCSSGSFASAAVRNSARNAPMNGPQVTVVQDVRDDAAQFRATQISGTVTA